MALLSLALVTLSSAPALAQRRARPPRTELGPLAARLAEFGGLPSGRTNAVELPLADLVTANLRPLWANPLGTRVAVTLDARGLRHAEAREWVEESVFAGGDRPTSEGLVQLIELLWARSSEESAIADCADLLEFRVQECDALVAAARRQPATSRWAAQDDGERLVRALAARSLAHGRAVQVVGRLSIELVELQRRAQRGGDGSIVAGTFMTLLRACPEGTPTMLQRLRTWHHGATPELMRCMAAVFLRSANRDAAALMLADTFRLGVRDARAILDLAPAEAEPAPDSPDASRTRDAEDIRAVVSRGRPSLEACWDGVLLGHDGVPMTRAEIDVSIATSGSVTAVTIRGDDRFGLHECLRGVVEAWHFPASAAPTRTSFPVAFQAAEPSDPP